MQGSTPRFPNKLLILGVAILVAGFLLLLWTLGELKQPFNLWTLVPIVAGMVFLYYRVFRSGPDSYLFLGIALLLAGLLLLITRIVVPLELAQIWPFFMTICGVSLLIYGLRKQGYTRLSLAIPGVATLFLSFLFLPFSLGIVERPFAEVVGEWWPLIVVALGIALLVLHVVREKVDRS